MALTYRCRGCRTVVAVGVPTTSLTRQVSEVLSAEVGHPVFYHDWSPAATDTSLRERAEKIWQQKCDAFFKASNNLRTLPEACPKCSAKYSWDIFLDMGLAQD